MSKKINGNINTIVFDLDGTLLNTLEDLKDSVNFALSLFGMPLRTLDEVRMFVGNGVRRLMQLAVVDGEDNPLFEDVFEAFRNHYREHSLDKTAPYEGIYELMHELKYKGYKMAIVSNKLDPAVKDLDSHFFDGLTDIALGESDAIKKKPAPDMVWAALDFIGVEKSQAIYVGDSDVDIMTAKNSGLQCVSVTWGFRDREFLLSHGAEIIIDKPMELGTLLLG